MAQPAAPAISPGPALRAALGGRTIVVTRPAAQAHGLAAAIEAEGGYAWRFPLLEISPPAELAPLEDIARRLDRFDFACFVSPNAVDYALGVVLQGRSWPAHLRAVTVGASSEAALARHGIARVIAPRERFDSEALLALPALAAEQVAGRRAVIFRGDGGRELLGEALAGRGATVEYATCYRRRRPPADAGPLIELARAGRLDALTLTSSEAAANLVELLGPDAAEVLGRTTLFAPHARIAERARELGAPNVVLTGPGDAGLLAGLISHFCNR